MPLFTYKAMREDGTAVSEDVMATSNAEVRDLLEAKGYLVVSIQKKGAGFGIAGGRGILLILRDSC